VKKVFVTLAHQESATSSSVRIHEESLIQKRSVIWCDTKCTHYRRQRPSHGEIRVHQETRFLPCCLFLVAWVTADVVLVQVRVTQGKN